MLKLVDRHATLTVNRAQDRNHLSANTAQDYSNLSATSLAVDRVSGRVFCEQVIVLVNNYVHIILYFIDFKRINKHKIDLKCLKQHINIFNVRNNSIVFSIRNLKIHMFLPVTADCVRITSVSLPDPESSYQVRVNRNVVLKDCNLLQRGGHEEICCFMVPSFITGVLYHLLRLCPRLSQCSHFCHVKLWSFWWKEMS